MNAIRSFQEIFEERKRQVKEEMVGQKTLRDFAINLEWVAEQFFFHNTEPKRQSLNALVQHEMAMFEMVQQYVSGGHFPPRDPEAVAKLDFNRPSAIQLLAEISVLHEFLTNLPDDIPEPVRQEINALAEKPIFKAIKGLAELVAVIAPIDAMIIEHFA